MDQRTASPASRPLGYRRIGKNVAKIFSANLLSALLNVATIALTARALGPAGVGVLALIEAYGRAVDAFVRLEPWQALLRYGIAAQEDGRTDALRRLLKFCFLFDFGGALLAATVAVAGVLAFGPALGLDGETQGAALAFSACLALSVSATSTGVLRMTGRFGQIATATVTLALAKLGATALVWWLVPTLWGFVAVMILHRSATHLSVLALGIRALKRSALLPRLSMPLAGVLRENAGLVRFIVMSNVNVVARQSTDRFDVLVVGGLLGAADAGIYQLARRIGTAAQKIDAPLRQCLFPEMSRLVARGQSGALRRLVLTLNAAIGGAGLLTLALAAPFLPEIVTRVFGEAFAPAATVLLWQLVAIVLLLCGSTLGPALTNLGATWVMLRITAVAAGVFFPLLFLLVREWGITYATLAHVGYAALWLGGAMVVFLRRTAPTAAAGADPAARSDRATEAPGEAALASGA